MPIHPWKVVGLEADYVGLWMVAGDIDGEVEIVSACMLSERIVYKKRNHVEAKCNLNSNTDCHSHFAAANSITRTGHCEQPRAGARC